MSKKFLTSKDNPLDEETPDTSPVDDAIYGTGEIKLQASNRIVGKPIGIMTIRPDFRQPRRVLPRGVQGDWDGSPDEIDDILLSFHEQAEAQFGKAIPIIEILNGRAPKDWQVPETDSDSPVFSAYVKIINLAQNIKADGLLNPISVVKERDGYVIETGERRWWAYQLLAQYVSKDDWGKIPAREVEYDPFRQASENNARDGLKAIEMARQVAILGMAILDSQFDYTPFKQIVIGDESDRRYYKQFANGNIHKIEDEVDRQRIQKSVGGLSWGRVSQYRSLLALTGNDIVDDAIWFAAEDGNWTENSMRVLKVPREWDEAFTKEYLKSLERTVNCNDWDYEDLIRVRESYAERFTTVKLEKQEAELRELEGKSDKAKWPSYAWVGKEAYHGSVKVFVEDMKSEYMVVVVYDDERRGAAHIATLRESLPEADVDKSEWPASVWVDKFADAGGQKVKVLYAIDANTVKVEDVKARRLHDIGITFLQEWVEPDSDSDKADTPQPATNRAFDKHGIPLMVGQTVKTRMGHIGKVEAIKGTLVNVDIPGNSYMGKAQYGESLEIVNPETPPQPSPNSEREQKEHSATPEKTDRYNAPLKIGQTVKTGNGIGKVIGFFHATVRVDINGRETTHLPHTLLIIEDIESDDSAVENVTYPDVQKWVGRPAVYQGMPVLVVTKSDEPGEVIIQFGNDRVSVQTDELSQPDLSQRAVDALIPPAGDGVAIDADTSDEYFLFDSHPLRPVLSAGISQALAAKGIVAIEDQKDIDITRKDIQRLLLLKVGELDRSELVTLLNSVADRIDHMNAVVAKARDEILLGVLEAQKDLSDV